MTADNPLQRIADLEQALKRALEIADMERRRANRERESRERAWQLAIWKRPTGLDQK